MVSLESDGMGALHTVMSSALSAAFHTPAWAGGHPAWAGGDVRVTLRELIIFCACWNAHSFKILHTPMFPLYFFSHHEFFI